MAESYWWSRYGNFDPGEGVLPHMGQVVAQYRKKYGCRTQAEFAIASGFKERTVVEWECSPMIVDQNRRIFLARMLKIPPALLGLDWRLIYYQDNQGMHDVDVPPEIAPEIANEESYYLYEQALDMAWSLCYTGKRMSIAGRIEWLIRKLEAAVERAPAIEREAWLGLLCQYYTLEAATMLHQPMDEANKRNSLRASGRALKLAREIEDQELIARLLLTRANIHFDQGHPTQTRVVASEALALAEKLNTHTPLYGNIQLMVPSMLAPTTEDDVQLLKTLRRTQDKVLNIVWDKTIEPDRSYTRLTLAGVHHERAKTLMELHKLSPKQGYLKDASNEMRLAWDSFSPEIGEWALYFHLTEAHLYAAQHELEQSAQAGVEAMKVARVMNSKRKEGAIVAFYQDLRRLDERNPYVRNLGVQLGMF